MKPRPIVFGRRGSTARGREKDDVVEMNKKPQRTHKHEECFPVRKRACVNREDQDHRPWKFRKTMSGTWHRWCRSRQETKSRSQEDS